jgi:hypothetical protein
MEGCAEAAAPQNVKRSLATYQVPVELLQNAAYTCCRGLVGDKLNRCAVLVKAGEVRSLKKLGSGGKSNEQSKNLHWLEAQKGGDSPQACGTASEVKSAVTFCWGLLLLLPLLCVRPHTQLLVLRRPVSLCHTPPFFLWP